MRLVFLVSLCTIFLIGLIGCQVSKPYVTKVDRKDQVIEGNRGYLKGTPPPVSQRGELKRPFLTVDIDLPQIQGSPTQPTIIVRPKSAEANEEAAVAKEEAPRFKEAVPVKKEEIK